MKFKNEFSFRNVIYLFVFILAAVLLIKASIDKISTQKDKDESNITLGNIDSTKFRSLDEMTKDIGNIIPEDENNSVYKNLPYGFYFEYPKTFEAKESDCQTLYLNYQDTQIIFKYYPDDYISNEIFRNSTKFFIENSTYQPNQINTFSVLEYNRADCVAVNDLSNTDVEALKEYPYINYISSSFDKKIIPNGCAYYATLNNKGFLLYGISQTYSTEALDTILYNILNSMQSYTPVNDELIVADSFESYTDEDSKIRFNFPSTWLQKKYKSGIVSFIPVNTSSNAYSNFRIDFISDKENTYVSDAAQFSSGISQNMGLAYMTSEIPPDVLTVSTAVHKCDLIDIKGKSAVNYEIVETLRPHTLAATSFLPITGSHLFCIRYTISVNGVPTMINFTYPEDKKEMAISLADKIMTSFCWY